MTFRDDRISELVHEIRTLESIKTTDGMREYLAPSHNLTLDDPSVIVWRVAYSYLRDLSVELAGLVRP